jgi:uncharacterized protein (DUF305 family)
MIQRKCHDTHRTFVIGRFVSLFVIASATGIACGDEDDGTATTTATETARPTNNGSSTAGTGGAPGTPTTGNPTATGGGTSAGSGGAIATGGSGGGESGGSGGTTATPPTNSELVGDRRVPFTPQNDREFAEFFIEHHQMAIDMSQHVLERGENPDVQALAQSIVDAQTEELGILRTAVTEIGDAQPEPAPMPSDPHTEADIAFMADLSGTELDQAFLLDMIPHHAGGLPPAHRARPNLERQDLQTVATNIFESQATEIGEMRELLEELGVTEAGEDRAASANDRPDFGLEGDRRVPLTPANDLEFVDFFISHHEMAIQMAEHEVENGENADVIALAESIRTAQTEELATMRNIRAQVAGSDEPAPMPADPHADPEMMEMMNTTGAELDRMFLTEMIPHHAGGLPTAHRADPHVENEELRTLANDMYLAQAEEIGEMKGLLDQLE